MKHAPKSRTVTAYASFKSHIVQMKQEIKKKLSKSFKVFKSHIVQMKPPGSTTRWNIIYALNPT